MEIIEANVALTGAKEHYRVITERLMFGGFIISIQKKCSFLWFDFWVTIKSFEGNELNDIFDEKYEEILAEVEEIYAKLINTYGKL